MDLNYKILWFEDTDEAFNTLSRRLERYIKSKNLKSNIERIKSANDFDLNQYDLNTYEVLIVDYKLNNNTVGQEIIKTIRKGKYVNDVLFYSSVGYGELERILRQDGLQGVFIADRENEEFLEKIKLLIDKSIRRAENLINIRGIVMDNTSEFDENMKNVMNLSWKSIAPDKKIFLSTYIKNKILKNKKETCISFIDKYSSDEIISISELLDEREFTSNMKAQLFHKFINLNTDITNIIKNEYSALFENTNFKENYDKEILWYRNKLAHVKKSTSETGDIFIGEMNGKTIVFGETLCNKIRENLIKYESLFDNIYNEIEMY